jgi:outer membrane receptor protein involved in Fe transport
VDTRNRARFVELQIGDGSGLYGRDAVGGAINIISPGPFASGPNDTHAAVKFPYGNLQSPVGTSVSSARGLALWSLQQRLHCPLRHPP